MLGLLRLELIDLLLKLVVALDGYSFLFGALILATKQRKLCQLCLKELLVNHVCIWRIAIGHLQNHSHHCHILFHNSKATIESFQLIFALAVVFLQFLLCLWDGYVASLDVVLGIQDQCPCCSSNIVGSRDHSTCSLHQGTLLCVVVGALCDLFIVLEHRLVDHFIEEPSRAVEATKTLQAVAEL